MLHCYKLYHIGKGKTKASLPKSVVKYSRKLMTQFGTTTPGTVILTTNHWKNVSHLENSERVLS